MKKLLPILLAFSATSAFAQPCNETLTASYNGPVCPGANINFNANIIGADSYMWTGPNNFNSPIRNPNIMASTQAAAGSYYLTVVIGACTYMDTLDVTFKPVPPAPALNYNNPTCIGDSIGIGSTSGGSTIYHIIDPLNSAFNTTNYLKFKLMNGEYKAYSVLSGCVSDTTKETVTLAAKPAKPVVTLAKPACEHGEISLAASATGGASQFKFWNEAGQMVTNPQTNVAHSQSGIYKCVAYNTAGCASDTASISVVVGATIIPGVAIYGPEEVGPFKSVTYTSYVSGAGQTPVYAWKRNNIAITGATNPTYTAVFGKDVMNNDEISLEVTADVATCPGTGMSNTIKMKTNLGVGNQHMNQLSVYPNPAKGNITISGLPQDTPVTLKVINKLGQTVYSQKTGNIKGQFTLNLDNAAAGLYFIKATSAEGSFTTNVVIE
jgi:hypothetical protein